MLYRRLGGWLSRPGAPAQIAGLAILLSLPAIAMGMVGDDYDLAAQVSHDPLSAYAFSPRDPDERERLMAQRHEQGSLPWWASPNYRQSFLRPLASLSHAVDFELFADAPWLMHLENSLLYGAIVLLVFGLYRRLSLPAPVLGLATFFYAFNGNHSMTVGWIAGRNTLLAALFGVLCIGLYVESRARHSHRALALSVLSLCAALMSAEGGVAALSYVLAHALTLQVGPLTRRLSHLWPFALVVVGWRIAYALGGYGVAGSGFYRDPTSDPLGYAVGLLCALPVYLASQLTVPYASMSGTTASSMGFSVGASLLLLWMLRGLLLPLLRQDPSARFLALGAALSVIPLGTTLPQDRLVFFVALGTCGLLAKLVHGRLSPPEPASPRAGARNLLFIHGAVLPALFVPVLFSSMNQALGGGARALEQALPKDASAHVVLLNGPSYMPVHFQRRMRAHRGERGIPTVDMLYAGAGEAEVRRLGEHLLEVRVARGWLATTIESLTRDPATEPFHAGQIIELPRMRVEVLEVTARGTPSTVRFELQPDGQPIYYAWHGRVPVPVKLPPVGASLSLKGVGPI